MVRTATTRDVPDGAVAAADRPPFRTILGLARYLTVCGIAGIVAGIVVGGAGGRLFMRIAGAAGGERAAGATTEAGFTVGEITLEGTLGLIVFVGIFAGIVGAALYVVFRPWLSWAGRWRGVAFGIVLFAVGSATSDVLNPDNFDFVLLGNEALIVAMIVALFVGFGALVDPVARWLDGRLSQVGRKPISSGWYAPVAILGVVLGTAALATSMFTRGTCDCDPPIVASIFIAVAAAGTLAWLASAFSGSARLPPIARVLGFVGLAGATAAGLVRAIGDAVLILRG
ncbi:MAG TPA: hypothetical protein VE669_01995 [Actinomycetota bacterium]|nr:hypothetical protein [Actinomycetota bacterium]